MRLIINIFLVVIKCSVVLVAQEKVTRWEDPAKYFENLFEKKEPLHLTLTFDVKNFQRTRADGEYHPAEMIQTIVDPAASDTSWTTYPVRVKTRGIFRRDHCWVPPFWLNIRYAGIDAGELGGIRRMKVVVRCRNAASYENYVLREYLVYKLYNLLTPYSFRVRLVRLKLVDTGRKHREMEDWAFLIEPEEMMTRRLGASTVESDDLTTRTVNRDVMDLLAMFQYMIGNGDYSVAGRHNLKILKSLDGSPVGYIPVPYDFDYTGLVNTDYAVPGEDLGIGSVREHYFLGPCRGRVLHEQAIEKLQALHDELVCTILGFPYLDEEEKMDMVSYLQEFFNQAGRPDFIEDHVFRTCRQ